MSKKVEKSASNNLFANVKKRFESIIAKLNASDKADSHLTAKAFAKCASRFNEKLVMNACDTLLVNDFSFIDNYQHSSARNKHESQRYLAVKACVKVAQILNACLQKNLALLDTHTLTIVKNAHNNKNAVSNSVQISSIAHNYEIDESARIIRSYKSYAESTAKTQRSSTCHALHALNAATYDDKMRVLTMNKESKIAKMLYSLIEESAK